MAPVAQPKVRSRKDGAPSRSTTPTSKLLNLLQGSFPLAQRPFAHVAELAELDRGRGDRARPATCSTSASSARSRRSSTRARSATARCSSPPRSTPSTRTARRKFINSHPGVTHNYLRNHDFNLWFTLAVEPGSQLGMQGTLDVLAEKTGAESIRQLPTLKLFKIRMDLEMVDGHRRAADGRRRPVEPLELDPIEVIRRRHRRRSAPPRARCRSIAEPFAPPPSGSASPRTRSSRRLESLQERKALRRVAAILFHRRAGFSANGMGVWEVPEDESSSIGRQMAAIRGICTATSARPTPTGPTRSSRWPTAAPRRSATRSSTRSPRRPGITERATLYSSTEYKKIRMLYFTDAFQDWEREHAGVTASLTDTRSAELYRRAVQVLPGGVNSPVRAMRSIGRDPIFVERAEGAELTDVDGNRYVDYVCSWGPLIHGHAHPAILAAVAAAAERGTTFGAPTEREVELAEVVAARMPSVEMLRMTSSGTEAAMSAIRLARAATGREKLLKFAGAYHGHVDGLLAEAGSGLATAGHPGLAGRARGGDAGDRDRARGTTRGRRARRARRSTSSPRSSPSPTRPTWASSRPARASSSCCASWPTANGALLVFDEVISGFRVAPGGAQELTGVLPDLTVMGKIIGGGLPAAAYGGPVELMERIAPAGDVYQAGTLSGNPLATAAGLAALRAARRRRLPRARRRPPRALADGLREAAGEPPVQVVTRRACSPSSSPRTPVTDYAGAAACDLDAHAAWCRALLARGVYPPPSQFEAWFPSPRPHARARRAHARGRGGGVRGDR